MIFISLSFLASFLLTFYRNIVTVSSVFVVAFSLFLWQFSDRQDRFSIRSVPRRLSGRPVLPQFVSGERAAAAPEEFEQTNEKRQS